MTQSLQNTCARQNLTDIIMDAKVRQGLTFEAINQGTGLSLAFVTAALLGQHPLPEQAARVVAAKLGLDEDAVRLLQAIPVRGSIPAVCRPTRLFIVSTRWYRSTAQPCGRWYMNNLVTG